MNSAEYISLLKDPAALQKLDVAELQRLVDEYPYAALNRMLLLKKLQYSSPDEFTASLPATAILSPSREELKRWVDAPLAEYQVASSKYQEEVVETPEIEETVAEPEPEPIPESEQVVEEVEETPVETQEPEPLAEPEETNSPFGEVQQSEFESESEEPEPIAEPEPPVEPEVPAHLSFSQWLKYVNEHKVPEPEATAEPAEDQLSQQYQAGQYEAELSLESDDTPLPDISSLLPKRLSGKAKAEPEKDFDGLAEKSSTLDNEAVTETLAKIYLIQNKLDKAKEAYEILIERFPEKKEQFLTQIKKIESQH